MNKDITIYVNGREKTYTEKNISFEQIVTLAYGQMNPSPDVTYTVSYSKNGNPGKGNQGTMVAGDSIKVHKGAIFNVTQTNRS